VPAAVLPNQQWRNQRADMESGGDAANFADGIRRETRTALVLQSHAYGYDPNGNVTARVVLVRPAKFSDNQG
jgi:hypothetical protein